MVKLYNKIANYLLQFSNDKYLHLIVGIIFAVIVSGISSLFTAYPIIIGLISTILLTILKEILDFIYKGNFDGKDIIFGSIGGIIRELLYLI